MPLLHLIRLPGRLLRHDESIDNEKRDTHADDEDDAEDKDGTGVSASPIAALDGAVEDFGGYGGDVFDREGGHLFRWLAAVYVQVRGWLTLIYCLYQPHGPLTSLSRQTVDVEKERRTDAQLDSN